MERREILKSRILIIDDKQANVDLLEEMLTSEGYTNVVGITDSRDALDLYHGFEPDLILLDLNMPFKDGFEVMAELRAVATAGYLPILVLTALQDEETRLRALDAGASDFLSKPFNRAEVLLRIRNLLQVRLLQNQVKLQNEQLEKHNLVLMETVRERTQELRETRLEVINRLGRAAEYRDNETGLHIIRMSRMSRALALGVGLPDQEAEAILNASPMHDIGKIGIPDRILLKPGKLNLDEWTVMKTHAEIGARILEGHSSDLLKTAATIAITHHEKWDGSGYPRGLKGEEIPLCGRICALADVFDALTSERPYKKAWPIEAALAEIKRGRAAHFDPQLVDLALQHIETFLEIKETYREPEKSPTEEPV